MKITIKVRHAYGNELIDAICENAKTFANLTGRKTLTRDALYHIAKLGYDFDIINSDKPAWLEELKAMAAR